MNLTAFGSLSGRKFPKSPNRSPIASVDVKPKRDHPGFTIVEIIVGVAIISIIAIVVFANVNPTAKASSDSERISIAAANFDELARNIAFFEPTKPAFSFHQVIGVYPSLLSQLTVPITTSQKNDCGVTFTNTQVNTWPAGVYYGRQIPTTGFKIADGFVALDSLVRVPPNNSTLAAGSLSIVVPNVVRGDAASLARIVDGDSTGAIGAVRFPATGDPVTMSYRIEIGGC